MLNTEINEFAVQSNLTQVSSYFDIVDNAVRTGDTNKRYTISTNACHAGPAPVYDGGWTSVVISPQGDNMCDLYNSFLTVRMKITYKLATAIATHESARGSRGGCCWIGFKDAMDAIEQYQLVANGQSFYNQSNAIEESFITGLAATDAVKKTDVFSKARHKDVWNGEDAAGLGHIIKSRDEGSCTLKLKIDLRRFLPLNGIKLLPKFVGNMELRLKFGTHGLVCAACSPEYCIGSAANMAALTEANYTNCEITNKFVPIGTSFKMITAYVQSSGTVTASDQTITVSASQVDQCYSHLACFGLDDNLYQGLIQRYTNESLSFPVQTLSFQDMNCTTTTTGCDFTLTTTPRFVDTIFLLIKKSGEYTTCYENPLFDNFILKMGGYGTMPDVQYSSYSPEFLELVTNALNINNDLTGVNKDVMLSVVNELNETKGYKSNDVTNFVMAFPASADFTWQQGQTSNTPISYQLRAQFSEQTSPFKGDNQTKAVMGFLKDSVFAIQLRPIGPPIVALDEFDITSPASE